MWNKLSMRDKANYIKLAIKSNITSLQDIQNIYNKYAEGGFTSEDSPPEDKRFLGLSGDEWVDIGTSMIPIYGTYKDAKELYHDPSWKNAMWLGVSLVSEIPFLKWLKVGKAAKAVKAVDRATEAAENYSKAKKKVDRMREIPNIKPSRIANASGEAGRAHLNMLETAREASQAKEAAKYFHLNPETSITAGAIADYVQALTNDNNQYAEGGDIILPELVVTQKGAYTNYTGNETITPNLEDYIQAKADETRYNAAFNMEKQKVPVIPRVPDRSTKGKALVASILDRMGVDNENILNIVGEDPAPFTCAYTATSQYPESSRVPGNITFSEDPSKYGFVKSSDPKIGDLVVSIRGQHPAHMSMVTSKTDWDYPLVSYSKGGAEPKDMVYNRLDWMRDLPRSTFYTYKGTEEEKKKWKKEYKKLYNSKK